MEFASRLRWILVIIFMVLFIVIVGWVLYSIAQSIFNPGGEDIVEVSEDVKSVQDVNSARFYVDGPVVAHPEHRSYKIEVTSGVVAMTVYKSYGSVVLNQRSYQNTSDAFDIFLKSLEGLNVTDRIEGTNQEDDNAEDGVCPNGKRRILELDDDVRRWTASCRGEDGTAGFRMSSVENLFEDQVPDFRQILRDAER